MHDRCAMKVGTDGVLLGAWVQPPSVGTVLDVGTGCGVIALMLAQRSGAQITGIEIDLEAVEQARENVDKSPWRNQVSIKHSSFTKHVDAGNDRYDLIVSNPPFFSKSLNAPDIHRTNARHQIELTLDRLFNGVKKLLKPNGSFSLVYPADQEHKLLVMGSVHSLHPARITYVQPTEVLPPKRLLVDFWNRKVTPKTDVIVIETTKRHNYTEEYKNLTKDYYLAF